MDKVKLYRQGKYVCEVPPVSHVRWTEQDWIAWIDSTGGWKTPAAEQRQKEREAKLVRDFYKEFNDA